MEWKEVGARKLLHLTSFFGALTLALAIILLIIFPSYVELADGYVTPIIAFEFAKNEADLVFLSGESAAAIQNRLLMDLGHKWDMIFPFAYAGFLALLIARLQEVKTIRLYALLGVSLSIIPFDLYENSILLDITGALSNGKSVKEQLHALALATWLKWGAIGMSFGALCLLFFQRKKFVAATICASAASSVLICWLSNTTPVFAEVMAALITICFLFLATSSFQQSYIVYKLSGKSS